MVVTIAMVIANVCFSRHHKADLESSISDIHTLATLTHLVAKNWTKHLQSNMSITYPELKQDFKMP
jgi:hypothetical protein